MPLAALPGLLAAALDGGYALCYCESWNLESFQAVLEAAEELRFPAIVGFNGGFLCHPSRSRPERLIYYGSLASAIRTSSVPVSFLLNETDDWNQIEEGFQVGFNAVMVEMPHSRDDGYVDLVKKVVRAAHARNIAVEAQFGHLPDSKEAGGTAGERTDPRKAREFVAETGIDALGVSIGNVHILTHGQASVDLDCLKQIREQVSIPLVIHGGSGFPVEAAAEARRLGVAKFNFGTNLKQAYLTAVRDKLGAYAEPMNPHRFLGMGGPEDILCAGREAVKRKAIELMRNYGNAGKASVS